LFTIRTIPSHITGTLICKRALLFGRFNVIKGLVFSFLSSQSRLRRDAFAVNTGYSIHPQLNTRWKRFAEDQALFVGGYGNYLFEDLDMGTGPLVGGQPVNYPLYDC